MSSKPLRRLYAQGVRTVFDLIVLELLQEHPDGLYYSDIAEAADSHSHDAKVQYCLKRLSALKLVLRQDYDNVATRLRPNGPTQRRAQYRLSAKGKRALAAIHR